MARTWWQLLLAAAVLILPSVRVAAQSTWPAAAQSSVDGAPFLPPSTLLDNWPEAVPTPAPDNLTPDFPPYPLAVQPVPPPPEEPCGLLQMARKLFPPPGPPGCGPDVGPLPGPAGWFWGLQLGIVGINVRNDMTGVVATHGGSSVPVSLGNTPMFIAAAPRFEIGKLLPSGLGAWAVADRLAGSFDNGFTALDGMSMRVTRMFVNYTDFDYISRDYQPSSVWQARWRVGCRLQESAINTQVCGTQPQNGNFFQEQRNQTFGVGPHVALEFERKLGPPGLSLVGKVDAADTFSQVTQTFAATTISGDNGLSISGSREQIPIVSVHAGLAWQCQTRLNFYLFAGYLEETWWNVLRNPSTGSSGNLEYQGAVLRAQVRY